MAWKGQFSMPEWVKMKKFYVKVEYGRCLAAVSNLCR
jgi:hypothetical protein